MSLQRRVCKLSVPSASSGWLADNLSWRWCFEINGPVGVIAFAMIAAILPAPKNLVEQRKRLQAPPCRQLDLICPLLTSAPRLDDLTVASVACGRHEADLPG